MCRFISTAVEDEGAAKRIFAGYSLWKNENESFKTEVGSAFKTMWLTDAHCSCAFYTSPYDPEAEAVKFRKKFTKPKYRKRGWTQERIEREEEHILKRSMEKGGLSESLFHCLQRYATEVGRCYFHIGWYSGDQNRQGLKIDERSEVLISSGSVNASEVYEDVFYTFT